MDALSLYTGAGGLDLGVEAAGFRIAACVEQDEACRATLRKNTDWPLVEPCDIHALEPRTLLQELGISTGALSLLTGGPPCQPFSKSGQWRSGTVPGLADPRAQTLRAYFDFVDAFLPKVMVLENVRGVVAEKSHPEGGGLARTLLHRAIGDINRRHGTSYRISIVHLDASSFGVPQKRERVFVIAERGGKTFRSPAPTHGEPLQPRKASAWDAIGSLSEIEPDPALRVTGTWAGLLPTIPEGCNYLHHTPRGEGLPLFGWRRKFWSFLLKLAKDRPSWTLTAQPGPATGPFHWDNRRLSVREMARLQTFPDAHEFEGTETEVRRQVGNAVPVALAEMLGLEIRRQLLGDRNTQEVTMIPLLLPDCPPPGPVADVPTEYLHLVGSHEAHPGTGKGAGALSRAHVAQ